VEWAGGEAMGNGAGLGDGFVAQLDEGRRGTGFVRAVWRSAILTPSGYLTRRIVEKTRMLKAFES
jgi:hypothetical protein